MWVDSIYQAELASLHVGALKAGVSVVTVDPSDSRDDVLSALVDTSAKGFYFSSET